MPGFLEEHIHEAPSVPGDDGLSLKERPHEALARNTLTGRFGGSPAIAAGRIFLRADDRLVAIGS
jgi:hypothetical protein